MNSTREIYAAHHKDIERHSGKMHADERGMFLKERIGTGYHILDIGCRNGAITKYYSPGNTVLGIDIDKDALDIAAQFGIETREADLNGDWNVQGKFDAVVATEILEHLYFPNKIIAKAKSVLLPGGMLIGSVPNAFSLKNRVRLFFARKRYTPLGDPTHINHFTYKELKEILESQFTHVEITPFGKYAWLDRFFPGWFAFMFFFVAYDEVVETCRPHYFGVFPNANPCTWCGWGNKLVI